MLSCACDDYNHDWYYYPPEDFTKFEASRRKRCISCGVLINHKSACLEFSCWRTPYSYIEENIYGDEVPLANKYMCETCGEIFLNLESIGYCITLGGNMKEDLRDYWDLTGFSPKKDGRIANQGMHLTGNSTGM